MKISSVKMLKFWCMNSLLLLLLLLLLLSALMLASGDGSNSTTSSLWQTLHGNKTLGLSEKFMLPVDNKGLASLTAPQDLPPAQTPKSVPTETNLVEPHLPSVVSKVGQPFDARNGFTSSAPPPKSNGQPKDPANSSLSILIIPFIVMVVLVAIFVIGVIFVTILDFVSQWACPGLREWLLQFDI